MDRRPDRLCYNRPCVRGDQKVVGPSHASDLVDPARPDPPVSHVCEAVEAHRTHDGRDHAALWNPCRGWEHGATLAHATAEPRGEDALVPDFSVALFRSDFVLFSEQNHMKAHKNQWVWTMPYSPEHLSGATSRGQTLAPEAKKPSQ